MKKISIAILSIICCAQYIQSMENEEIRSITDQEYRNILCESKDFNTTKRFINVLSIRNNNDGQFILKQKVDLLSLKLYNLKLNTTEIEDLINQGADPNYEEPNLYYYNCNVVTYHAKNKTKQGLENMSYFIKIGAAATGIKNTYSPITPLTAASKSNNTDMIKLLLHFELSVAPDVNNGLTYTKKQRKKIVISRAFTHQNVEIITLLLDLKFITPYKALNKFAHNMIPNEDISNLLREYGAICNDDILTDVTNKTFPSDLYLQVLTQITTLDNNLDDNSKALPTLYTIQKMVNASIKSLENNKANQNK